MDLRQWSQWCINHDIDLFEERRAHIELFARWLEETGRARSTIARRLSTIAGFYRYCTEEKLIDHSPAAHVRRPKVSYESNQVGLDRNELGMFLVQAGIAGGRDDALACMLALNGLRISEALGADIEHSGMVRGHRIMTVTRKGGGIVTVPIAPRTGRAIDLCVGERTEGPILLVAPIVAVDEFWCCLKAMVVYARTGEHQTTRPIRIRRQDGTKHTYLDWADGLGGTVFPLVVGSSPTRGADRHTRSAVRRHPPVNEADVRYVRRSTGSPGCLAGMRAAVGPGWLSRHRQGRWSG